MNGQLKKVCYVILLIALNACGGPAVTDGNFAHADFSGGSSSYGVYVPSQGRSIMSSLSF